MLVGRKNWSSRWGREMSIAKVDKCVPQHQAECLFTCRGLEVLFPTMGIGGGGVVFAVDEAERSAWCRCLVTSIEVVCEALFEIRRVADIEFAVGFGEEDIDTVAEFCEG
jgi:hypothetical protein